jgi:hypothetical protein
MLVHFARAEISPIHFAINSSHGMSLFLILVVRLALAITTQDIDQPNEKLDGYLRVGVYVLAGSLVAVIAGYKLCRHRIN